MKTPSEEDLKIWELLGQQVEKHHNTTYQVPIVYRKERPQLRFDAIQPVAKSTQTVGTLIQNKELKKYRVDGEIDLHGNTLEQAHRRLEQFLKHSQYKNFKLILVITGKGLNGEGVLKVEIPRWLESNPAYVISYTPANDGGAFYVRVRKP